MRNTRKKTKYPTSLTQPLSLAFRRCGEHMQSRYVGLPRAETNHRPDIYLSDILKHGAFLATTERSWLDHSSMDMRRSCYGKLFNSNHWYSPSTRKYCSHNDLSAIRCSDVTKLQSLRHDQQRKLFKSGPGRYWSLTLSTRVVSAELC